MISKIAFLFRRKYNSRKYQLEYWEKHLLEFSNSNNNPSVYGYEWGDPDDPENVLGNYLSIKQKLIDSITDNMVVLEIGTLGGKWTRYLLNAKKIICVDINKYFISYIKKLFPESIDKLDFYISEGNELKGVIDSSVDLIFTMDTLVRVDKDYIYDYFSEMKRVLRPGGKIICHLPNSDLTDSQAKRFTKLNSAEIKHQAQKYFSDYSIDSKTIVHGSILFATK
ncbi:class I SAM-dependent methyltransferase [candidate division KSB1 bacterium]|nr:class I SAM-dependent methyltransferase [candidate division KSB1 bacterium]